MIIEECKIGKLKILIKDLTSLQVHISVSEVQLTLSPANWPEMDTSENKNKSVKKNGGIVNNA
jgi:hypothetical protein